MLTPKEAQENCVKWVQENTQQHYFLANEQISLYPLSEYTDVLTEKGQKYLTYCQQLADANEFKGEFVEYYVEFIRTGSWFADKTSQFYNTKHPFLDGEVEGAWCTWRNACVVGLTSSGKPMKTSACVILMNEGDGVHWCYTYSGSMYKLGKEATTFEEREEINTKGDEWREANGY